MSSILHTLVERSYVWHRNIYIIREVRTVEHRSLSALADAGSNPFSLVHRMQGLVYMMQVIERILNGKIIPVARTRHRLVEITVLYGNDIRIEEFGKFFNISFTQRIVGIISFCHEHGRTVESSMAEHHPLFEITLGCILGIELLLDKEHILSGKCVLFSVSTLLTPGKAASCLPATPSSAASICKGRMKSSSINFKISVSSDSLFYLLYSKIQDCKYILYVS